MGGRNRALRLPGGATARSASSPAAARTDTESTLVGVSARADAVLDRLVGDRPKLAKLARYSSASVAGAVTSQVVLLVCFVALDIDAVPSNIIAVTAGAVPNYLINRAWTFNKRGKHSLFKEVIPFWGMALLGLVLSTFAVAWADDRYGGNALILMAANIGSFGVLWVAKYFVLERVLFKPFEHFVDDHVLHEDREPTPAD